jgi:hypothetical protein
MESESSMVPHHQWVQVLAPEEELWPLDICHGSLVSTFFGICIYSRLLLLRNSSTLPVFIQRWLLWKDHKDVCIQVSKPLFRIHPALIATTLEWQLWHLTPYVTYRSTHKLYPNYSNMLYNTISVLVTDESNCIAGNHWDFKNLRCNPRIAISLESTMNSNTSYRTMFWSILQVSWSNELTCNIEKRRETKN